MSGKQHPSQLTPSGPLHRVTLSASPTPPGHESCFRRTLTRKIVKLSCQIVKPSCQAGSALPAARRKRKPRISLGTCASPSVRGGVDANGGGMRGGTELMSEGMYRALESLVGLIVERRYDELVAASRGRLAPEDLRRRIEEDYPVRLVMPRASTTRSKRSRGRRGALTASSTSSTSGTRRARLTCTSTASWSQLATAGSSPPSTTSRSDGLAAGEQPRTVERFNEARAALPGARQTHLRSACPHDCSHSR